MKEPTLVKNFQLHHLWKYFLRPDRIKGTWKNPQWWTLNNHSTAHNATRHFPIFFEFKEHERTHTGENLLIPSDIDKVDMPLLRKFKKQKNFCNNLIKRDIRKALGRNVNNKSSLTEIWKAIVDILKPERMACNNWKI